MQPASCEGRVCPRPRPSTAIRRSLDIFRAVRFEQLSDSEDEPQTESTAPGGPTRLSSPSPAHSCKQGPKPGLVDSAMMASRVSLAAAAAGGKECSAGPIHRAGRLRALGLCGCHSMLLETGVPSAPRHLPLHSAKAPSRSTSPLQSRAEACTVDTGQPAACCHTSHLTTPATVRSTSRRQWTPARSRSALSRWRACC